HVLALDPLAFVMDVEVRRANVRNVERIVRQQARARLLACMFRALHGGEIALARIARGRADEAAEVGEAHALRLEVRSDLRALLAGFHLEGAAEIALADAALEIREADALLAVVELALEVVGRRFDERDADDGFKLREVLARKREVQ